MQAYETLLNIHGGIGADIRQFFSDSPGLNAFRSKATVKEHVQNTPPNLTEARNLR
jgi:glucokinase